MNPFPAEKLTKIKKQIDRALKSGANPVAAFDADGTLWDADLGENFFEYQIAKKLVDLPPTPWEHYNQMQTVDVPKAYTWLAQINKNIPLVQVQKWAKEALHELGNVPIFPGIKEIIKHLQSSDVRVYVVTASIKWAVEPGAELLGIPKENVIGITTKVAGGAVTEVPEGPVTWREGKVVGLLNATNKVLPFFAAGNTLGDLALLDCSTHLRLVNAAAPEGHRIRETEQKLIDVAIKRGWFYHVYRN